MQRRNWLSLGGGGPGYQFGCCRIGPDQRLAGLQSSRQFESGDLCALHLFAAGLSWTLLRLELPLIGRLKQQQYERFHRSWPLAAAAQSFRVLSHLSE